MPLWCTEGVTYSLDIGLSEPGLFESFNFKVHANIKITHIKELGLYIFMYKQHTLLFKSLPYVVNKTMTFFFLSISFIFIFRKLMQFETSLKTPDLV